MAELFLKIGGALCIFIAVAAFGEFKARSYGLRVGQLKQFQQSLKLLANEISFARSVLPQAFRNVAGQIDSPVRELYLTAAEALSDKSCFTAQEAWQQSLAAISPKSSFSRSDTEVIRSLGISLGASRREGQLKQIELTLQHLEYALGNAQDSKLRNEKMSRYLGFLGGAALVILLL